MSDPFSDAQSGFIRASDYAGRLVLIEVKDLKKDLPSSEAGKSYDAIVADVHVLDGDVTEMFEMNKPYTTPDGATHAAFTVEGSQLSGAALVPQLRGKVGKSYPHNMILGRMKTQPSKRFTRGAPAAILDPPTEADKVLARAFLNTRDPFAG